MVVMLTQKMERKENINDFRTTSSPRFSVLIEKINFVYTITDTLPIFPVTQWFNLKTGSSPVNFKVSTYKIVLKKKILYT